MDNWLFRLIQRLTPGAIVIAGLALISVIVLIFMPEWAENFPYLRDSVTALSTAAMVIVTLLLAYATLNVINSDRQREECNKKERLLNEIIEWATDIKRCGWEVEYTIPSEPIKVDIEMFQLQMSANRLSRFMVPSAKNKYVTEIALILGENLCLAVKDTKNNLIIFLPNYRKLFHLVSRK